MANSPTRRDGPQAGPREEQAAASAARTSRDGSPDQHPSPPPGSAHGGVLPPPLGDRYRIQRRLSHGSGEADVWLAHDSVDGRDVVVKLYYFNVEPQSDVLERVKFLGTEHVIDLLDYGRTTDADGKWYELLEYAPHGSLETMMVGAVEPALVRAVLTEVVTALRYFHDNGLFHRDLKPANVLVRSRDPLDLVLADFGITRPVDGHHVTRLQATWLYAAPEVLQEQIGRPVDYWAIGMMVFEWLNGAHPWEGLSESTIRQRLVNSDFGFIADVRDPEWRSLCAGLLQRLPDRRWGSEQVGAWLEGKCPPAPQPSPDVPAPRAFTIGGEECTSLPQLALLIAKHWDAGVQQFGRGKVLDWVRRELRNEETAAFVSMLMDEDRLDINERLLRFLVHVAPTQPRVYKRISLARPDLHALANDALAGDVKACEAIRELRDRNILELVTHGELVQVGRAWAAAIALYHASPRAARGRPDDQVLAALLRIVTEGSRDLAQPITAADLKNLVPAASSGPPSRARYTFDQGSPWDSTGFRD